jgi:5-methylcytosine-specific restriction protein A
VLTKPCIACGEDAVPGQSRCTDCRLPRTPRASSTARGYPAWWTRLSEQARKLQPWCSTCGRAERPLTVDHTPQAWAKVQAGKRLTLKDFAAGLLSVECLQCNVDKGHARGSGISRSTR